MSTEKTLKEALRWLATAEEDLDVAVILKTNKKFAHACFHAQQAGEKAVKALWYFADADPWGHSIKKLIDDLQQVSVTLFKLLEPFLRNGMLLDRFYIPTRYPNGLPDITPDEAFDNKDADTCIESSREIVDAVKTRIAK